MRYNPDKHHRKSIRLKGYDYSRAGAYFVTICAQDRECWFGEIIDGNMNLNDAGKMVHNWWNRLPQKFSNIELDELIVMPNHLHGILILRKNAGASLVDAPINAKNITPPETIQNDDLNDLSGKIYLDEKRAGTRPAPTNIGLADMVGSFKSLTTNEYIKGVKNSNWPPFNRQLWQRNYYEHIIRDENDLNRIRKYIIENPLNWKSDHENPGNMETK